MSEKAPEYKDIQSLPERSTNSLEQVGSEKPISQYLFHRIYERCTTIASEPEQEITSSDSLLKRTSAELLKSKLEQLSQEATDAEMTDILRPFQSFLIGSVNTGYQDGVLKEILYEDIRKNNDTELNPLTLSLTAFYQRCLFYYDEYNRIRPSYVENTATRNLLSEPGSVIQHKTLPLWLDGKTDHITALIEHSVEGINILHQLFPQVPAYINLATQKEAYQDIDREEIYDELKVIMKGSLGTAFSSLLAANYFQYFEGKQQDLEVRPASIELDRYYLIDAVLQSAQAQEPAVVMQTKTIKRHIKEDTSFILSPNSLMEASFLCAEMSDGVVTQFSGVKPNEFGNDVQAASTLQAINQQIKHINIMLDAKDSGLNNKGRKEQKRVLKILNDKRDLLLTQQSWQYVDLTKDQMQQGFITDIGKMIAPSTYDQFMAFCYAVTELYPSQRRGRNEQQRTVLAHEFKEPKILVYSEIVIPNFETNLSLQSSQSDQRQDSVFKLLQSDKDYLLALAEELKKIKQIPQIIEEFRKD